MEDGSKPYKCKRKILSNGLSLFTVLLRCKGFSNSLKGQKCRDFIVPCRRIFSKGYLASSYWLHTQKEHFLQTKELLNFTCIHHIRFRCSLWVATKQQIYFYWFFSIYCLLAINSEQKTIKSIFFIICQIFAILEDFIKITYCHMLNLLWKMVQIRKKYKRL